MLRLILISVFVLFVSACSQEQSALSEFKKSKEATDLNKCVGANGNIEWSIFKTESTSNPDVRVIQALMTKGEEKFMLQWYYNVKTNISEFAYLGKNGQQSSRLAASLDFSSFCIRSGFPTIKKDNASSSNDSKTTTTIKDAEKQSPSQDTSSTKQSRTTKSTQEIPKSEPRLEPKPEPRQKPSELHSTLEMLNCSKPAYPQVAIRLQQEGTTTLKLTVNSSGTLTNLEIDQSSGYPILDQAAIVAVKTCSFSFKEPNTYTNESTHILKYTWKLE